MYFRSDVDVQYPYIPSVLRMAFTSDLLCTVIIIRSTATAISVSVPLHRLLTTETLLRIA